MHFAFASHEDGRVRIGTQGEDARFIAEARERGAELCDDLFDSPDRVGVVAFINVQDSQ